MPLYPYRCIQCGHSFEKIQSFDATPETECPKCQGVLERPMTAPALQFKGAGWYVNDYSGKSNVPAAASPAAPAPACASSGACPSAAACPAAPKP